jgi:hypothetical protein
VTVGSPFSTAIESRTDQTVGIVLGASRFPNLVIDSQRLGLAFAKSKVEVKRYLNRICGHVLDCFDSAKLPNRLCLEVADFLEHHSLATDLIVYYVGHGGFLNSQEYFVACRATREKQKHATGLRVSDLATSIITSFRNRRVYLIFDCCFAGSAADSFQAASDDLIAKQSEKLPTGVSLLNASSRNEAAVVPQGGARTMFSECLLEVLRRGIPRRSEHLSLREVGNAVTDIVMERYPDIGVRPEVHSPRQRDGDVADVPIFPNPSYVKQEPKNAPSAGGITALELARLYNFPRKFNGKGECIGIISLGGMDFRESDLEQYFASIDAPVPLVKRVSVNLGDEQKSADYGRRSAHLTSQIEVCGAVAPAARLVIYQSSNTNEGFIEAIQAAAVDEKNRPTVLLIAWGAPESAWGHQFVQAMERALTSAALAGMTICCASGDIVASSSLRDRTEVSYPASSPLVVAVGGTSMKVSDGRIVDETACASFVAGVSRVFPRPEWQRLIVVPGAEKHGRSGRAVPDVSAHAEPSEGYRVFVDGNWTQVGGTTASCALWAGLLALLNEAVGRRPAFTHRDLYEIYGPAHVLRGIDAGDYSAAHPLGEETGAPWRSATGWGAPDGGALVTAARICSLLHARNGPNS